MKDVILEEIKKDLNWKERIVVRLFPSIFIKVYYHGEQYVESIIKKLCNKYCLRKEFVEFLIKMILKETQEHKTKSIEEYIKILF